MSGTSNEALYGGETTVRGYMAQGEFVLAIGVLVQHYQDAIVSYCQCHLLDQEVAREVAQEIFLAAFESIPGFCGYSSIKTWLYGIAFKKCLEVERNRKRREALVRDHQETIGARVHCDPLGQSVARLGCQDTATHTHQAKLTEQIMTRAASVPSPSGRG